MNGDLVPMYQWRAVVHRADPRPVRIRHAFSRFRNRPGAPMQISMCNQTFAVTDFLRGSGDTTAGRCFACVNAVSPYAGP